MAPPGHSIVLFSVPSSAIEEGGSTPDTHVMQKMLLLVY